MADETGARLEKLEAFRKDGIDPYPAVSHRTATTAAAVASFDTWEKEEKEITLSGRVFVTRGHGGILFTHLKDASGKLQIALKKDVVGTDEFESFQERIDPGDFIEATGTLFVTKRGEQTLNVTKWQILAKALRPLPEKWHGLTDLETRYRERELDLLVNDSVKHRFILRSKAVRAIRSFLDERGFTEVETPMLQSIPGGANARPFKTHHHALDIDLYLRIAPELYLKRLLVGGFEKVYEMGRCFRNEGIDHAHNPEFTMLELYWAYAGKDSFISFLEEFVIHVINETIGDLKFSYEGQELNFKAPWPRRTFREVVLEKTEIDIDELKSIGDVEAAAKKKKIKVDFTECVGLGECLDELYKKTARKDLIQPTWILDYPIELKPLARKNPDDGTKSSSVQLLVHGSEIMNCYYHELNDPIDQRHRLKEQQALKDQGSSTAQQVDDAFLRALEHGMPPAAGMGIGIDRFVMLLSGVHNIKETILFPTLRPESEHQVET